jgi:CBS domain-containing protein
MNVGEFCNRTVVIIQPGNTVLEAAQRMLEHHVGDLVVVAIDEDGARKPIGIITDRDIVLRVVARGRSAAEVLVWDAMSPELKAIEAPASVGDAMERMKAFGIRRLPVVDARGSLLGIVTVDDLFEFLADESAAIAELVTREQKLERKRRVARLNPA